ncbi:phosphoglycerate mutase-like protein [Xylariomycetidae sp. FL2044]|nr:phosphoglycerate mutase-like protein [Xylariomycetidae sp. FL2044]
MAPVIHLVRHAQGFHNLSPDNQLIRDPGLTAEGEQQCADLRARFPAHHQITHLAASPIRRTLQTCLLAFAPAAAAGKRVIALPDAQEVSALPCDTGTDPAALAAEFGDRVDIGLVAPGWNDKAPGSRYCPTPENLAERSRGARVWLRDLVRQAGENSQVVLVTHGGFLHYLTEDWEGTVPERAGTGWANTEVRSYEFADPTGEDPNASLKETQTSRRSRMGSAIPLTETEQMELARAWQTTLSENLRKYDLRVAEHVAMLEKKAAEESVQV